jgi:acetate kinase
LAWLGLVLDADANQANAPVISAPQSRVKILVLPTNEEAIVAKACRHVMPLSVNVS